MQAFIIHLVITIGFGFTSSVVVAAEHIVEQKDKKFTTEKITLKVGDTIKFVNKDTTSHHIFSSSDAIKFNMGIEKPGEEISQSFSKEGEGEVRCAIHPQMKLKVKVEK